ncbi:hypothetical protein CRG98_022891 [Punica granatum]|uniref:Uncharacterized protein n=1 Tax=Punica granatum TaxID=22663 RepID=A0A2I0JKC9_PUNGR|nr:hypothetical protein CRG98_022891 [Punica granatum]
MAEILWMRDPDSSNQGLLTLDRHAPGNACVAFCYGITLNNRKGDCSNGVVIFVVVLVVGIVPRVLQVPGVGLTRLWLRRVPKRVNVVGPIVFPVQDLELLNVGPVMVMVALGKLLQAGALEVKDFKARKVGGAVQGQDIGRRQEEVGLSGCGGTVRVEIRVRVCIRGVRGRIVVRDVNDVIKDQIDVIREPN